MDENGLIKLAAINKTALNLEFNRLFTWERYDKRSNKWFIVDAPTQYSLTLFDAMSYEHLPPILSVANQPFVRGDNTLCRISGYDRVSKIYGIFDELDYRMPEHPTERQVIKSKAAITELLKEFEFKTEADFSAALCAIFTATVRAALPTAVGFLATAHSAGSGKSYLLDMIGQFASTTPAAAASFLTDDDEMRKQLLATLIESPSIIKFDEMKSDLLPIKTLLSCLSAEQIEGRILGFSKIVRPSTRTLMLFAGNNVQAVNDMCRRIMTIHLDVQSESPATRNFKDPPLKKLTANRARYVAHALTLIQWGLQQIVKVDKPLCGFDRWDELCRRTVMALGYSDPCMNMFEQLDYDPDRKQLGATLDAWYSLHGSRSMKVRDVIDNTPVNSMLYELLLDASYSKEKTIDNRLLSRWIKRNVGKFVNGKRFEQDTRTKNNVAKFFVRLTLQAAASQVHDLSDLSDYSKTLPNESDKSDKSGAFTPPAQSGSEEKFFVGEI